MKIEARIMEARRVGKLVSGGALALLLVAACSSQQVPLGEDDVGSGSGGMGSGDPTPGDAGASQADPAVCEDGRRNGDETDVDCGGSCVPCALGQSCETDTDCVDGWCHSGACDVARCNDWVRNGREADVDCGGETCPPCEAGASCTAHLDCQSQICRAGSCQTPSCADGRINGDESDLDCGGSCPGCEAGMGCVDGSDCASGVCQDAVCEPPSCDDGVRNGEETNVDCGGPACPGCGDGLPCRADEECASGICSNLIGFMEGPWTNSDGWVCVSCSDGLTNGGETDVDCGGPNCGPCDVGGGCWIQADCGELVCSEVAWDGPELCVPLTCYDGVLSGDETDIDCGGSCRGCRVGQACDGFQDCFEAACHSNVCSQDECAGIPNDFEPGVECGGDNCALCPDGNTCERNSDCAGGWCNVSTGLCEEAACDDAVRNGFETDIDCGGHECAICSAGQACRLDRDCTSGICEGEPHDFTRRPSPENPAGICR